MYRLRLEQAAEAQDAAALPASLGEAALMTSVTELAATATPDCPFYWKVAQRPEDPHRGFYQVMVSEGWRQMVLCADMYETYADWLVEKLQGCPLPDAAQVTRPLTGLDKVKEAIKRARGGPAAPGVQGYA